VPSNVHQGNNTVGGMIFQIIGVIFGILLGFMIPAVWTQFQDAGLNVEQETNDLAVLYRLSAEAPEPTRSNLRTGLMNYAQLVVEKEWPLMAQSQSSLEVASTLDRLWQIYRDFEPANDAELALHNQMFGQLRDIGDRRHDRLYDSRTRLEPVMWMMLIGGGVITVLFSLFMRSSNDRNQVVMVAILAAMIGFGLLLVMMLDSPFSGDVRVQPDSFEQIMEFFRRTQQAQ
jgi:hypothetical protein